MRTKNQRYSEAVFQNISQLKGQLGESSDRLKRYKSLCKRAGGLLRTVGLIQFLAFLEAKATSESEKHNGDLLQHLQKESNGLGFVKSNNKDEFLNAIRKQELPDYMQATQEILLLLQWHKRLADVLIEGTAEGLEED